MFWINAKDEISRKSEIVLQGKISHFLWWHYGVKNTVLELFYRKEKIGECSSNAEGYFSLPFRFPEAGLHQVHLRLKENPSNTETLTVLIPEEKTPKDILICDVDNTLVDFSFFSFLFQMGLSEIPGARATLKHLSEKYYIVYLTHRDKRFTQITKKWIEKHEFPPGPVFFWSIKDDPFLSKRYKEKTLLKIKKKAGVSLAVGVGDRSSDIEAYEAAGIPQTFLIKQGEDWKKIQEVLP